MTVLKVKTAGPVNKPWLSQTWSVPQTHVPCARVMCLQYWDETDHSVVTPRHGDERGLSSLPGGRDTLLHTSALFDSLLVNFTKTGITIITAFWKVNWGKMNKKKGCPLEGLRLGAQRQRIQLPLASGTEVGKALWDAYWLRKALRRRSVEDRGSCCCWWETTDIRAFLGNAVWG